MNTSHQVQSIRVVDSHTAGEPTRVVIDGGPDLGSGPIKERAARFSEQFDRYRTAMINEPRGYDVIVGALMVPPENPSAAAGVIFFNNIGLLGMCGHGLIGVVATLRHCGQLRSNDCKIETPVGLVQAVVGDDGLISIDNVESYRMAAEVKLDIDGIGSVVGDVAWGGNWFFLVREPQPEISLKRIDELVSACRRIRDAVRLAGYPQVDHIELFSDPSEDQADSQNFVFCPGSQYDRSPCGTGTSAKLACLAADGKLGPGKPWVQEGILGTHFLARYRWSDQSKLCIVPTISGRAYVTAEATFYIDPADPFAWGIPRS